MMLLRYDWSMRISNSHFETDFPNVDPTKEGWYTDKKDLMLVYDGVIHVWNNMTMESLKKDLATVLDLPMLGSAVKVKE